MEGIILFMIPMRQYSSTVRFLSSEYQELNRFKSPRLTEYQILYKKKTHANESHYHDVEKIR